MQRVPFYDAGTSPSRGIRSVVVLARRLVRRLLRPMLFHLDADLKALSERQDDFEKRMKSALALGWDHVAMARRLAVLEDHINELLSARQEGEPAHSPDGVARPSIRYPGRDVQRPDEPLHLVAPQSKVS